MRPGDLPDQLAAEIPERVDVVTMPEARRPPRLLGREHGRHQLPVQSAAGRQRRTNGRQSSLMAEQLANGDLVLPGCAELAASSWLPARPAVSRPSPISLARQAARTPLPTENTLTSVSGDHGNWWAASVQPPRRSAAILPPTIRQSAAPISPRSREVQLELPRARPANRGSHQPLTTDCVMRRVAFPSGLLHDSVLQ